MASTIKSTCTIFYGWTVYRLIAINRFKSIVSILGRQSPRHSESDYRIVNTRKLLICIGFTYQCNNDSTVYILRFIFVCLQVNTYVVCISNEPIMIFNSKFNDFEFWRSNPKVHQSGMRSEEAEWNEASRVRFPIQAIKVLRLSNATVGLSAYVLYEWRVLTRALKRCWMSFNVVTILRNWFFWKLFCH